MSLNKCVVCFFDPTKSTSIYYFLLPTSLEHFKKFCSRALWQDEGARILEYLLYTAGLCSSFLTLNRLQYFLTRSNDVGSYF
jgi:predicted cupin superfamily sugar epimerase